MKQKNTRSAGGVVVNSEGQILVVSQRDRTWSLPKGHQKHGETLLTAAKREIKEETGITRLKLIKPLGNYQRYRLADDGSDDASELKTITMFLFSTKQTNLAPRDPDNPRALWIDKSRVADVLTHERDKNFIRHLVKDMHA